MPGRYDSSPEVGQLPHVVLAELPSQLSHGATSLYGSRMSAPFWISQLLVSQPTAEKIKNSHGLQVAALRQALECKRGLRGTAEQTFAGKRMYLNIVLDGARVKVVLAPHDYEVDVWYLASAYRT